MRRSGWSVLLMAALWLLPSVADAQYLRQNPSLHKSNSPGVKNLRSLAGCWKGRGPHGGDTKLFYEVVSAGTALIEYLRPMANSTPQITVYYLDGEVLMAHHFCYYGSQIRMKAESTSDSKLLVFRLHDASNLTADRHENHMTYIKMNFSDVDHLEADWGQFDKGKEYPSYFSLTRVVEGCKGIDFNAW